MITADGRRLIKRSMAGQSGGSVASYIAVGIGNAAATLNDQQLQFEFARVPVVVTDYDFVNNRVVYKGTLDEDVAGTVYEIGLWTGEIPNVDGNGPSMIITTFDSEEEEWGGGTFDAAARIGADALKHAPAASAVVSSLLLDLELDLSQYQAQDVFSLAYSVQNSFTASIKFRFRTDSANYYEYTIASPTTGYKFTTIPKGTATVVGTPDWSEIGEIEMLTTATSGGSASVIFDALRLEDTTGSDVEYGLIARHVLSSPVTKAEGIVRDIEYSLAVNI